MNLKYFGKFLLPIKLGSEIDKIWANSKIEKSFYFKNIDK